MNDRDSENPRTAAARRSTSRSSRSATATRCISRPAYSRATIPLFVQALCRAEPAKRHRFVVFIDGNVAASWPALTHSIAAYAQEHAESLELVGAAGDPAGRRAGQERSGAGDAPAAAPGRPRDRPALVRRGHRRRGVARPRRLRRGDDASRRAARAAADHGAGAERRGHRREERRQRLRHEELPRQLRAAARRAERRGLPAHAASARPASPASPRR